MIDRQSFDRRSRSFVRGRDRDRHFVKRSQDERDREILVVLSKTSTN